MSQPKIGLAPAIALHQQDYKVQMLSLHKELVFYNDTSLRMKTRC